MTKRKRCDIIIRLSLKATLSSRGSLEDELRKKSKEILKNLLTNRNESDIMDRLLKSSERKPWDHVDLEENQEKLKNNFEKPLDKLEKM